MLFSLRIKKSGTCCSGSCYASSSRFHRDLRICLIASMNLMSFLLCMIHREPLIIRAPAISSVPGRVPSQSHLWRRTSGFYLSYTIVLHR